MKKAVIACGGVQHLVAEGDEIVVNHMETNGKSVEFAPLMVVDGSRSIVDATQLKSAKVKAEILDEELKGDKVIAIRYKSKKRVNTKRGHRQKLTKIKIVSV